MNYLKHRLDICYIEISTSEQKALIYTQRTKMETLVILKNSPCVHSMKYVVIDWKFPEKYDINFTLSLYFCLRTRSLIILGLKHLQKHAQNHLLYTGALFLNWFCSSIQWPLSSNNTTVMTIIVRRCITE